MKCDTASTIMSSEFLYVTCNRFVFLETGKVNELHSLCVDE